MATSDARRYQLRKAFWLDYLGGKCALCSSTERLEFDHIDPATKVTDLTRWMNLPYERVKPEADKCQLLCHACHKLKTLSQIEPAKHGTRSRYGNKHRCGCSACTEANNRHNHEVAAQKLKRALQLMAFTFYTLAIKA
jgi:hypothetical protein